MTDTIVIEWAGTGEHRRLDVRAWMGPADSVDLSALAGCAPPVLDVGCGPGRIAAALAERGVPALGIDSSPSAAAQAVDRGASVLCRSVFDRVPGAGRWGTVALFDGNVGIGGDPLRLLHRTIDLVAEDGAVLVEVEPPGRSTLVDRARLRTADGTTGWFPWARVGADHIAHLGAAAGFGACLTERVERRWFARLSEPVPVDRRPTLHGLSMRVPS